MLMNWILFLTGLAIMIFAGDKFVDAAVSLAEKTGIPKMLVGATIVSIATTIPEFTVSTMAVAGGTADVGIGNALGSIICNTGLILSLSLLLRPGKVTPDFRSKALMLVFSLCLTMVFSWDNRLSFMEALALYGVLIAYMALNLLQSRRYLSRGAAPPKETPGFCLIFFTFTVSVTGIIIGSRLLIDNGVAIARYMGVPSSVIALSMIALGTSLPELTTAITAIVKKENALSIGNVIGANLLNIVLILSTCAALQPGGLRFTMEHVFGWGFPLTKLIDLPFALLLTLIFILPCLLKKRTYRLQGLLLLSLYAGYLCFLFTCVH